jgi:anti-sigma factor RsiW
VREESRPITDEELHAYVDGLLDAERRAAVDRYLRAQPEVAQRTNIYSTQRNEIRMALAARANEPIPASLSLNRLVEARLARRPARWRVAAVAAMVVLAFGLGGAGGWYFGSRLPTGLDSLVEDAAASYTVYTADKRRPVELWAAERDDLARWLSNRLNRPVSPPDLAGLGYQLLGGRLVATGHGPAALFMYENARNIRLTLFVRPMPVGRTTPIEDVDAGDLDGCAWIDRGVGYMVIAAEPYTRLQELSERVRQQAHAID